MTLIPHLQFINIPVTCYKALGQEIFEPDITNRSSTKNLKILFILSLFSYNLQWGLQLVYFIRSLRNGSILEVTAVAPCLGFGFVGNFKQLTLYSKKMTIQRILKDLEYLHPKTERLQADYNVFDRVRSINIVMKFFAGLCLLNTAYFGLFPLAASITAVLRNNAEFDYPQGFPVWYPFDVSRSWLTYAVSYSLQLWAGTVAAIAVLTADLLLVSIVTQLCMQFDYISKSLQQYNPQSEQQDREFLSRIIKRHTKCLELTESIDDVFRFSLLLNLLTSSSMICFVGFEVITASSKEVLRFSMLFVTSMVQVLIICIYGDMLIDASLLVGEAAYVHPWYNADLAYQNTIVLLICRSQRFAAIHAPTFPPISLQTFMKVISMSYQFFAVLQTTYAKQ